LAAGCPILAIVHQICTLRSNLRMSEITDYSAGGGMGGGEEGHTPPDSSSKNTSLPDQPEIASYGPGSVPDLKPRLSAHVSPVVDTDELATTFLDEHQLAKQGLYVEHKEGPDYRKPVCV